MEAVISNFKTIVILIFLFISTGCTTTPIGYIKAKPVDINGESFRVGYSEELIAENRFHVKFQGNGYNTTTDVYKKFLRRSAEIAHENKMLYYKVEKGEQGKGGWAQAP